MVTSFCSVLTWTGEVPTNRQGVLTKVQHQSQFQLQAQAKGPTPPKFFAIVNFPTPVFLSTATRTRWNPTNDRRIPFTDCFSFFCVYRLRLCSVDYCEFSALTEYLIHIFFHCRKPSVSSQVAAPGGHSPSMPISRLVVHTLRMIDTTTR